MECKRIIVNPCVKSVWVVSAFREPRFFVVSKIEQEMQ